MTDRENLPVVINQQVVVHTGQRGSLVMRGLVAVQNSTLAKTDDALYREARDAYNSITSYGFHIFGARESTDNAEVKATFDAFQRLANNNYGEAYYPLSILYFCKQKNMDSESIAQHFAKLAIEWCLANQANQDVELWCDLGDMYQCGVGVAKDGAQAKYWYRKAAELGDMRGQCQLGSVMLTNHNGAKEQEAFFWMGKAAEQGLAPLQAWLGQLYEFRDSEMAAYWSHKAFESYRAVAENTRDKFIQAEAQYELGEMYSAGNGVEQNDAQAVFWYRKAAEQGNSSAQQVLEDFCIDWRKQDAS